mgnify:CR=1 FL=1|tara:strand:+ start:231 stop:752 length:522 start_codon:yes stop_codon:yes gene_type:complete
MSNIMVDLETMSTQPNAAIVAIGAVKFGAKGRGEEFYKTIDLDSSVKAGGHIDPKTIIWWMGQSAEAHKAITGDNVSLFVALQEFSKFVGAKKEVKIWGNGAAFDNIVLGCAYDSVNLTRPWNFWNDRCYRTIKNMFSNGIEFVEPEIKHHALDDAIAQADHLCKILDAIQKG